MAGDSDANLTGLAAGILREAVEIFDQEDVERWLGVANVGVFAGGDATGAFTAVTGSFAAVTGSSPGNTASFPALTGSFPALTQSFPALTGSFSTLESGDDDPNAGPGLKNAFKLPRKLPGVRLPSDDRLAAQARSAPIMQMLEALARWLGSDGRLVGAGDELSGTDAADAARWLGIRPQYLTYLWDYALTTGWFELEDDPNRGRTWAVLGETAWRWADGDDSGALHVWAAVFAAVLTRTLDVAATEDPRASRRLKFQGQGVVTAVTLFLARRAGKSGAEIRDLLMSGAIGDRPSSRARRAWDGWVRGHGDPARWLLDELAALRAIGPPSGDDGIIELTPLALWALREQLRRDGVEISLLKASSAQMTAAALAIFADGLTDAEIETEFNAWLAARGADRGAHELLVFAAFSGPQLRLAAVNLVRRIGPAAHLAWLDSMHRPELRGYARIALAGMAADLPESTLSLVLDPDPGDLARVATDLLSLACGEKFPDPQEIAAQLSRAIPAGEEALVFDLMSRSSHPDVVQVLMVLGRSHPDRQIAKEARRAARVAARNRVPRGHRAPAGAARR
jgi:hypothetical protein